MTYFHGAFLWQKRNYPLKNERSASLRSNKRGLSAKTRPRSIPKTKAFNAIWHVPTEGGFVYILLNILLNFLLRLLLPIYLLKHLRMHLEMNQGSLQNSSRQDMDGKMVG